MTESVSVDALAGGAVVRVVFERDKGNVLTTALLAQLDAALAEHAADPHAKLLLLEGAGKHFSLGASIEEHRRDRAAEMLATFHRTIRRVALHPVPVAAVVRGKALGGAFELALACNFVVAARGAAFACPEIALGVFPPVLAALGPLRLGAAWAERLALTGEELGAERAHAAGFVTELAPDGVDPFDHAMAWYEKTFAKRSAFALREALAATRDASGALRALGGLKDVERRYLARVVPSFDGNEGIAAFLEKREPRWRDA